ncbi:MAG: hypothetical protein APR55_02070 [Methanolinea sp. SDB]|nr:MAG: hypothetical protein APR55_02070 [Methanolinea sp. SDB]
MNRLFQNAFIFLVLAIAIYSAGCSSQDTDKEGPSSDAIREISEPYEEIPEKIHFQDALLSLHSMNLTGDDAKVSIHFIRGENLSIDGSASLWIFGVKQHRTNYFIEISPTYHDIIPWRAWLPRDEIDFTRIISPDRLLEMNLQVIQDTYHMDEPIQIGELELANGVYIIKSTDSGETTILKLDAVSGRILY